MIFASLPIKSVLGASTILYEGFEGAFPGSTWTVGDNNPDNGLDYWDDTSYRSYAGSWSGWCAEIGTKETTTVIFTEGFEGAFPGTAWTVGDSNSLGGQDYWDDTSYRSYSGSWSGWCAQVGDQWGMPNSLFHTYDNYMDAYMYRGVSLSGYTAATLSYHYWLVSESGYDYLEVLYYDGGWYYTDYHDGDSGGWQYSSISIPTTATAVGFFFHSDSSNVYEGAYIDDVQMTGTVTTSNLAVHQYDNNMDAYMWASVSLGSYSSVTLSYDYWINSESGFDYLYVTYYDGSWHNIDSHTGNSYGWQTSSVSIPTTATKVGFRFISDSSVNNYEGAYVDEIRLEGTLVDTTPPPAPDISSSTHPNENVWYTNNDPTFQWTTPSDISGIAGYSYILDQSPTTTPDQTIDTTENTKSYTDLGDGTWYFHVRAKDNADNWGSAKHYQANIDTQSPSGTISINQGATYATSTSVTLTLTYSDAASGVSKVRYSNDGIWDTEQWENPSGTKAWTLTSGDEVKTVYYQVKDNVGYISPTYSDSITLDTVSPTGSITVADGVTYATTTTVTLTLSASDTTSGITQMRLSNDGVLDTESWEAYATSKSWTLSSGDGMKTVYAQFKDNAGQTSTTYSDTIILDTTSPTGSIKINNDAAETTSTSVTLTLSANDANGVAQMHFSNDGSAWSSWETFETSRLWTLTSDYGTKTVYVEFKDNAGLVSSSYLDAINLVSPLMPTWVLWIVGGLVISLAAMAIAIVALIRRKK